MLEDSPPQKLGNSLYFILGFAIALRIPMLGEGIWFDEIRLVTEFTRLSFGELIGTYGSDNNHPLYTVLAWLTTASFGEEVWAIRLPALIFGILSLIALARLSALVLGQKKAVLVTLLGAISYHHIWFSNNARGYTALLFFTLAATYELICLLDDRGRERLLTYSLSLALATWVHTTAVFIGMAHLFVVLFMSGRARPRGLLGLILATIFSLFLHAPILGEMIEFLGGDSGFQKVASTWTNPLWTIAEIFRTFGIPPWLGAIVAGVGLFFGIVGLRKLSAIDRRLPYLFFLPAAFGTATMLLLERNIWPRFYFNLLGFFLIVGILCLDSCVEFVDRKIGRFRATPKIAYAVVCLAFLMILPPALVVPKQDYPTAAKYLDQRQSEGAKIVTVGLAVKPYESYYEKSYIGVDNLDRMREIMSANKIVYVVDTLSTYLESRTPRLAALISDRFEMVATFPGTVGGGEIKIYKMMPL